MPLKKTEDFVLKSAGRKKVIATVSSFVVSMERKPLSDDGPLAVVVKITELSSLLNGAASGMFGMLAAGSGLTLYLQADEDTTTLHTYSTAMTQEPGKIGGWDVTEQEISDCWQARKNTVQKFLRNHLGEVFEDVIETEVDMLTAWVFRELYYEFVAEESRA